MEAGSALSSPWGGVCTAEPGAGLLVVQLGGVQEAGPGLCQPGPPVGGGYMPPPGTPAEPSEPALCFPFLGTVRHRGIRSHTRTCGGNEVVPPLSSGGVSAKSGAELLPRHPQPAWHSEPRSGQAHVGGTCLSTQPPCCLSAGTHAACWLKTSS